MKLLGFEVSVRKAVPASPVYENRGSWWPIVREPFTGAWQRNITWTTDTVLAYHAVYACITLISSDFGKLRALLKELDGDGIWTETFSASFSPVLQKPNHFQNHIQWKEWWMTSILVHGNVYALKERDNRGVVVALYLLDPRRVKVLVAPDGSVFYQLNQDNLSGLEESVTIPAEEIIHDRINCLFHPLVGTSPIFACGNAANVGLRIQDNSTSFFGNASIPAGTLTAPGVITTETAEALSARWKQLYSGDNAGKVAVLGNNLKFEQLRMTSVDAQLIEQLKWTAEVVCSVFHVPPFKIGVGAAPTYSNGEIADQRYYSDCLQSHIEHYELAMDEGLGLNKKLDSGKRLGVELDLDGLLRMDSATQMDTLTKGVRGGVLTPNGARRKLDEKPLHGGDTIYLQHQDYPIEQVFERTDLNAPKPAPPPVEPEPPKPNEEAEERSAVLFWKDARIERPTRKRAA